MRAVHAHAGHSHAAPGDGDSRRLTIALALIGCFMVVEVVVGILASSLALISDAAHMLTDAGALVLSLVVIRLMRRPAQGNLTFGLRRTEILSAQANGAALLVLGLLIVYEAIRRLITPPDAGGKAMLVVAIAGIVVNLVATRVLAGADRRSMNVEGSYQHLLTDLAAFVITAVAGVVILATGQTRADGLASLVIAAIMLRASYVLLRDSGRVLLEAAPEGMDTEEIGRALAGHAQVVNVHDLHIWEIGTDFPALSAHVLVAPGDDCHAVRRDLETLLSSQFGITHTTLQVEHETAGRLLHIGGES
jgi:cobalt-zinc-cadmium efflux system protein